MNRPTALLCFCVTGVIAALAAMATLLYLVGALGVFGDPPHTRGVDAVVAVVLLLVARGAQLLANRFGRAWQAQRR